MEYYLLRPDEFIDLDHANVTCPCPDGLACHACIA
jgi:hypothetical protein